MLDVISIGSATEDVFVHIPKSYSSKGNYVFRPGVKVEIEKMDIHTGGGATNTAVAFSRLGLKAGIMAVVGEDGSAETILKEMKKEKVNAKLVKKLKGKNTAYSVILTGFGRDRVILYYAKAARLSDIKIDVKKLKAKWFYISSLHAKPELLKKIAEQVKKVKAKIAFNPGQKELALGIKGLKRIFGKIDVLLLNKEEALKLTHSADIHRNLKKLLGVAETVVITEGKEGAHAGNEEFVYSIKSFNTQALDVTGAGDAFGSGFTAAIIKGKGIEKALIYGTANANSVIRYLGTKNILLSERELKKFAKKNKPKIRKRKN